MKIKNQTDPRLEEATQTIYKAGFYSGKMNSNCGKYTGMPVIEAKDKMKEEMKTGGLLEIFYELSGKVICRCLTPGVAKIVSDQWFLKYGDKEWKKITHEALNKLKLYPELIRPQFDYVLDWLNDWACTHHHGAGTKLPWDEHWVIESLSDSTIYMAYYTIAHKIESFSIKEINDKFFDYIFLGIGLGRKEWDVLKKEFEYWYPFDVRSTAKDLVQNHMSFCLFNHTAIFPERYWPKAFSVNGWLLVNGEKMSKSKGNFFTIRQMLKKYPADVIRATLILGGEGLDDPNFDFGNADNIKQKIEQWYKFALKNYKKTNKQELNQSDKIFLHHINKNLGEGTRAMENMMFRTGFDKFFYQMQKALRDYISRGEMNQDLINQFINIQTKIISPICPHITEEIWHELGNKTFLSLESWPKVDESKIDEKLEQAEKNAEKSVSDILNVLNIIKQKTGKEGKKIYLYVIPNELNNYNAEAIGKKVGKEIKVFAVNDKIKYDPEGKASKAKPGKPGIYLE